jgi:ribonuclease III
MTAMSLAVPPDLDPRLDALQRRLRVRFRDRGLLFQALVHRSAINERIDLQLSSNERLEFLGDAVLGAVVAERLYTAFPAASEGVLTVTRAALVRASSLADWARAIDLGQFLLLGRGEEVGGGRNRETLLASAFEAVVGAIYLDRGLHRAAVFLDRFVAPHLQAAPHERPLLDAKSRLQQLSQSERDAVPRYQVVDINGPQHGPTFTIEVTVGGRAIARGSGRSKQAAEQAAAQTALETWDDGLPRDAMLDGATSGQAADAAAAPSLAAAADAAEAAGDGGMGASHDGPAAVVDDAAPSTAPETTSVPTRSPRTKRAPVAATDRVRRPASGEET